MVFGIYYKISWPQKKVIAYALWMIGYACTSYADPPTQSVVPDEPWQQLQKTLDALRERHNIPVVAIAMTGESNQLHHFVLGGSIDTPLRWGSITKTMTALTVLGLHERGLVDLEAPLANYVDPTAWQNPWRKQAPVTVIQLLELRAGFSDLSGLEFNHNTPLTLQAALNLNPSHRITRWPPGLQHGYSNMAPGLTQLLIEEVTGMSYADAVQKFVFTPLQMQQANFQPRARLPGGFKADGVSPIPYWHMTFPAYGALNASLSDMQQLLGALLGNTRRRDQQPGKTLIKARTLEYLWRPHARALAPEFTFDYAAGFYPRVRRGHVWHTHGGDADGYRGRIAVMAGHRRGYIVNINTDNPTALREIEGVLETYLSRGIEKTTVIPLNPADATDLTSLVGEYYPSSTRFAVERWQAGALSVAQISIKDEQLWFTNGSRRRRLIDMGHGQFRRPSDPVATVVFAHQGQHLYLQGELGNYVHLRHCPDFLSTLSQCNRQ